MTDEWGVLFETYVNEVLRPEYSGTLSGIDECTIEDGAQAFDAAILDGSS